MNLKSALWINHGRPAAQNEGNKKKLRHTVSGEGKVLNQGKFGSRILGSAMIDVPVASLTETKDGKELRHEDSATAGP